MKKKSLVITLPFLAVTWFTISVAAQAAAIMPVPKKLSDHSYAWIGPYDPPNKTNQGFRMNLGFVVGSKAVAIIDSGYTPAMAREMVRHIKSITKLPIKYVINTNSQPHRFFGNSVFKKDSIKIPALPEKGITSKQSFNLGGVTIQLIPMAANHTPASLIVDVVEDNIIYTGDVLYGGRLLAVLPESNTKSWLKSFDSLKKYGNVTYVPGHGQPGNLDSFKRPTRDYLQLLYSHMSKAVENGVDLQDAINTLDQKQFADLVNYKEISGRNASWAYLEREKASFE